MTTHSAATGAGIPSKRRNRLRWVDYAAAFLAIGAGYCSDSLRQSLTIPIDRMTGKHTTVDRLQQYSALVRGRLAPKFAAAGCGYPPPRLTLIGLKHERRLEVWATASDGRQRLVLAYEILGASGGLGPKLREGDRQVPEGVYAIEALNPNSAYHLSLRLNYPNAFDLEMARRDGRDRPGSDIMIHGSRSSIGCLAMGDEAAEDLFVLAAETGIENITVILSPVDFRVRDLPADLPPAPPWTGELYGRIREALAPFVTSR